jgi:carboxylesterase
MGALLALLLAEEFQSDIAGVGCLSPTLFYDGWNVPWYNCLLPIASKTFLRRFVYVKDEPPYGFKNERIRAKVHEYYENADINDDEKVDRMGYPYFPLSLLGELRRMSAHLSTRLGRVRSPCQILQARHDDTSSPRNAQVIYDRISSTRKEIVYLENSYHVITADQERATVAQKLTEFFSMKAVHA